MRTERGARLRVEPQEGGYAALRSRGVRCFLLANLVPRLSHAHRAGTVEHMLQDSHRTKLVMLDEWGPVPLDRDGTQPLVRRVANRYETRSLLLTTNLRVKGKSLDRRPSDDRHD